MGLDLKLSRSHTEEEEQRLISQGIFPPLITFGEILPAASELKITQVLMLNMFRFCIICLIGDNMLSAISVRRNSGHRFK